MPRLWFLNSATQISPSIYRGNDGNDPARGWDGAHTSAGRSPCRNAMRIIVASRCPWRPRLRATSMSSPTSLTVRYSRGRRVALDTRRGGTVPFTAIGVRRRLPLLPLCFLVLDRMTVP
jgi:hypothetical protein